MLRCKLCRDIITVPFFSDPPRTYLHCDSCDLIYTTEDSHPTYSQEKERYEMHDNSATNDGYVRFLETIAEVVIANTPAEGSVLDFGCGKNAVLETIIKRQSSLNCDSYDPNFNRFLSSSETIYDTIVLCEVIEHIRDLQEELDLIELLLKKPDGRVIIRTQKYQSLETFPTWWYRQDSTHVNFFNDRSLSIFASQLSRKCIHTPYKDIVILQPETTPD